MPITLIEIVQMGLDLTKIQNSLSAKIAELESQLKQANYRIIELELELEKHNAIHDK